MKKSLLEHFIIFIFRAYQLLISPFVAPSCRFSPTCSNYTIQAIEKHGVFNGLLYSVKRVFMCHPFYSKTGYDPVP